MTARGARRPLSVAPMMDFTDRHLRWVLRRITRHTLLYTEMVTGMAIRHGDRDKLLAFDPSEHPVALQLGGDDPALLADCARIAEDLGYDEVNLNVGCPSDRVRSGCFGAVLMRTPDRVAEIVAAMRARVAIPVTVKHRIGVDGLEDYADLDRFVTTVAAAGADRFTVHARIAVLGGLSPKENREIPPLRYADVHALKAAHPDLWIEINGGIGTLDEAERQLDRVDGVMIGRAVVDAPMLLADADRRLFGDPSPPTTVDAVLDAVEGYVADQLGRGSPGFEPRYVLRHLVNLYVGVPGARRWRRTLSEQAVRGLDALREARQAIH
ncbi:MAG: tRNA dihydrouridine(20/20a) synthase DusA [Myxococcota bacterium]